MYVLLIRRVTLRDAGMYTCELNSPNVTRSFHELKIISDRLMAPVVASDHDDNDSDNDSDNDNDYRFSLDFQHPNNYRLRISGVRNSDKVSRILF